MSIALGPEMRVHGAEISAAIKNCAHAERVVGILIKPPANMSNAMARTAVELIAFTLIARGLKKLSVSGEAALKDILAIQKKILKLQSQILEAANDNKPMAKATREVLPDLAEQHRNLEKALLRLYEHPAAKDFGIGGEKPPAVMPPKERAPIRPKEFDALPKPNRKKSRIEAKGLKPLKLLSELGDVVEAVTGFKVSKGGKSSSLRVNGKAYKVVRVFRFDSAQGPVFLFDIKDPSVIGGVRRAVQTQVKGETKMFLEFTMLEFPYGEKPVFAHLMHANHPITDVKMGAFGVFGKGAYAYREAWTMLMSDSRSGTPHWTITNRQAGRGAASASWRAEAEEVFRGAMEFKQAGGKAKDFKPDLRKFSFGRLVEEAGEDMKAAGVPDSEREMCLKAFKQQAREKLLPLFEEKLLPEHAKTLSEGMR